VAAESASVRCTLSSKNVVKTPRLLPIGTTSTALTYYHDHPREMHTVEQEREDAMEDFRESIDRPESVDPDAALRQPPPTIAVSPP
jgi:hypothetical protein